MRIVVGMRNNTTSPPPAVASLPDALSPPSSESGTDIAGAATGAGEDGAGGEPIDVIDATSIVADIACRDLLDLNAERVEHFRRRAIERGLAPADTLIVVLDGDCRLGCMFAEPLMPPDWQAPHRAMGAKPIARGLASRGPMNDMLDQFFPAVGAWMRGCDTAAVLVVTAEHVASFGVAP